jgi:hypothetical protein
MFRTAIKMKIFGINYCIRRRCPSQAACNSYSSPVARCGECSGSTRKRLAFRTLPTKFGGVSLVERRLVERRLVELRRQRTFVDLGSSLSIKPPKSKVFYNRKQKKCREV